MGNVTTFDIFRRSQDGPVWIKGEDNLEIAKLEALRFAAKSRADYFIIDLQH